MLTAHRRATARTRHRVAMLLAAVTLIGAPVATGVSEQASAASSPVAVVVVGPMGTATSSYRLEGRRIVDQLRAYGARVRFVYSPYATWGRVGEAARGANLFVYLGRGRGNPGPYGVFDARTMNGLGLNAASDRGDSNVRHYGEAYLKRSLGLASGAVVILARVPYAAGSSEAGRAAPTRRTATLRADNYATGFLAGGATAVFSSDRSVSTVIRDLFRSRLSMRSIFWGSPWTSTRYDSTFSSQRSPGATGVLAPYGAGQYKQAVVGFLGRTAPTWRATWGGPVPAVSGSSVRVSSVPALLSALANNAVTQIVLADGTYHVSPAAKQASDSLWIGERFAHRTNPVLVRAETTGGVVFDGGGTNSFGGITFVAGAHHQTWQGFVWQNGSPFTPPADGTGVIVFGGYAGQAAPHHITLRDVTVRGITGVGHAMYVSWSRGGVHDIVLDGFAVDDPDAVLRSAIHFYHSDGANVNAWNFTVRNLRVVGTQQAIMLWDSTLHDITIDTALIRDAQDFAVRYESPGATNILLTNIVSTGSGSGRGFASSLGSKPPGVTFVDNSLN